jgi:hypothetical protein
MSAEIKQLATPNTHVEVWFSPEDTATISISMSGAPCNFVWIQKAIEDAAKEAKAQGKTFARIFINHVML